MAEHNVDKVTMSTSWLAAVHARCVQYIDRLNARGLTAAKGDVSAFWSDILRHDTSRQNYRLQRDSHNAARCDLSRWRLGAGRHGAETRRGNCGSLGSHPIAPAWLSRESRRAGSWRASLLRISGRHLQCEREHHRVHSTAYHSMVRAAWTRRQSFAGAGDRS